jgi:hypothetical protein
MPSPIVWPISPWQRFTLLVDQGRPGFARSPWFTMNAVVRLSGPVRVEALRAAFNDLVACHELLRTRLVDDGPEPFQLVSPRVAAEVELVDEAQLLVDEAVVHAPVALERAAPIRLRLARRSTDEYLLALHIHHIMADPDTLWAALRELAAHYTSQLGGRPPTAPSAQYGEFARVQVELARSGYAEARSWWRRATRNVRARAVRPGPSTGGYYERAELLSPDELTGVRYWSRTARSTLFVTLLAALARSVAPCYDSSGPLLFTTMLGRRDSPRWRRMLGSCTLPVYLSVPEPPERLSADYVSQVRDWVLNCHRHARFPVAEVEELAGVPGHASRGATYTVPFFEYLPIQWPTGLRFGDATGTVLGATGPRDDGELRSMTVRSRTDADGALVARVACDGRGWTEQRLHQVCQEFRTQAAALVGPR